MGLKEVQFEINTLRLQFDAHLEKEDMEVKALQRIEDSLKVNTERTNEMYEAFMPMKAGLTVVATVGKVTKVLFWPIAFAVAIITYIRTGHWPIQ